jgi:hypothetical protein
MVSGGGIDAADLLRTARARSGLSQRSVARRAGTAQSVLARIELGETNPTVATLNRLLLAAGFEPVVSLRAPGGEGEARELSESVRGHFADSGVRGIASVYLFGSAARGRMHRESDVDVAVLLDRSVYPSRVDRSELRVRLSADLAASTGIDAIDLVVLNDLPPTFARSIVLDGTRLLRADPALDHRFIRDIQLRAADLEPFLRRALALKLQRLGA